MTSTFLAAAQQRHQDAIGTIGSAIFSDRDVTSALLVHLPVRDRLRAMQVCTTWRDAGSDAASWSICDFDHEMSGGGWTRVSANAVVRRALELAGPSLTVLRVHSACLGWGALRPLEACPKLDVLDVSGCKALTLEDILECLPRNTSTRKLPRLCIAGMRGAR